MQVKRWFPHSSLPLPFLNLSFAKIYFLLIFSIYFQTCRLRESRRQSLCDASVCAFQVFDWESFAVTVRHYCLQPKNFDSNIEESVMSSTSIYFSFIKDGDDDVDTPCWIKLDVLPALEQGQGNVTQGKGLLVRRSLATSRKQWKVLACHTFGAPVTPGVFRRRFSLGS